MYRRLSSFFLLLVLLLFTAVQGPPLFAVEQKPPRFSDVILTSSVNGLLLFGKLNNGFSEEMLQGLHSGIPIQFSFFVELNRVRKYWADERILGVEFRHTLTYDTLKETYKVELEEMGRKVVTFQALPQAQKAMGEINGLKVIPLANLIADESYSLRLRAELFKKTLPMGLHHVVPFISRWDIQTDWYSVNFNY